MTTTTRNISKTIRIGTIKGAGSVYCKISYKNGKLSISGVEGPLGNGNARGSCGQIILGFKEYDKRGFKSLEDITPADGWTAERIKQLFDIWHSWHLNDMQAACEHQRANWDIDGEVEIVTYCLTRDAHRDRRESQNKAMNAAANGIAAELSEQERALLSAKLTTTHAPDADGPLSGCYEVDKRETKSVNWVRPDEHPRGILGASCDVCGYKYGSKWLKVDVPEEVLDVLESFQDTDITPAWV